jgi:hypothetical protein
MLKRDILLRPSAAAIAVIVMTYGVMYYRAHRAMVAARQYVSDVSRLQIGMSGSREFDEIRNKYKRFVDIEPNCKQDDCSVGFRFDNGLPIGASFVRPAVLYSGLTLSHGTIASSVIRSSCYGKNGGEFITVMWESLPNATHGVPFREGRTMSSADTVAGMSFNLTPAASWEQKAQAYAFHTSFLGRFAACNDATEMH